MCKVGRMCVLYGDVYIDNKLCNTTVIAVSNSEKPLENMVRDMASKHNTKAVWTDSGLEYGHDNFQYVCYIEDVPIVE